ncbi:MAG: phosphoglycerate kinase, partial [Phycisphaerae bacterium]
LRLPVDTVATGRIEPDAASIVVQDGQIPQDMKGADIGPQTIKAYREAILQAKTILWNGPMGVFEVKPFDAGTIGIAQAVAEATTAGAVSVIGGGDTAAAVDAAGLEERMSHISTGGGASLEFLQERHFEAIDLLDEA